MNIHSASLKDKRVHSVSLKGKRAQNEDKHNIIINMDGENKDILNINFYGIYDGHGGKFVSKFLAKNLPNFFVDKRVRYPLRRAYINKTYTYLQNMLKENYEKHVNHCGATCLVTIQYKHKNDEYITVMNSGDSRCVLCRENFAVPLTKDHKPIWPEEKRRIEKLGGEIYFDGSDYRIKDLSVSRAFGDLDAQPYVTNIPDVFRYKIDKNNDKFIIMACDGLWDVFTDSEAVNFILNECYDEVFNKKKPTINIAHKLAEAAITRGSMDNVSILVIFLQ